MLIRKVHSMFHPTRAPFAVGATDDSFCSVLLYACKAVLSDVNVIPFRDSNFCHVTGLNKFHGNGSIASREGVLSDMSINFETLRLR